MVLIPQGKGYGGGRLPQKQKNPDESGFLSAGNL